MTVKEALLCICMVAISCMQRVCQFVLGTLPMNSHADCQTTHDALTEKIKSPFLAMWSVVFPRRHSPVSNIAGISTQQQTVQVSSSCTYHDRSP